MTQRLFDTAKWIWCLLVLNYGPLSNPISSVTARTPPKDPSTIEAQAKFFQDFFSVQLSPYKIEFGHVCEDPSTWEQRYEKKDFMNHRDMGKVRWGDKKGGYGEHYWDLNHAGHAGNHDSYDNSDDGSYHEDPNENYNGSNEHDHSQNYESAEYNPDISSHYEESERKKRAHGKIKSTITKNDETQEEQHNKPQNKGSKGDLKPKIQMDVDDEISETPINHRPQVKPKRRLKERKLSGLDGITLDREKNNIVLVINQRDKEEDQMKEIEPKPFVPLAGGAEMRQHVRPEITTAPGPRLFLEPSTGYVIDRTTGQTYILQPVPHSNNNS